MIGTVYITFVGIANISAIQYPASNNRQFQEARARISATVLPVSPNFASVVPSDA